MTRFPNRCFAFDQFGPLSIRPHHGVAWTRHTKPTGYPPPITALMASATSTAATASATTDCGV